MPLISVILPVYNSEKYIGDAIKSILAQSFTDFELLVINDASTDGTADIINSFSDDRLRLVTNETSLKVVKSLNKGLQLANSMLIARMDADDIALPDRFASQVDYLNQNPHIDICATRVHVFGDQNHIHFTPVDHNAIKASLLFQNSIIHPSVMFRRQSFADLNIKYNEAFKNAEDYGLWAAIIDVLKFGTVPKVLLKYRIHDSNVSVLKHSNWDIIKQINHQIYENFLTKAGVQYSKADLDTHISIGFRLTTAISMDHFEECMQWLEKIVLANNKSKYFDRQSLYNEVIEHIILIQRKLKTTPAVLLVILKMLFKIFNPKQLLYYIIFKKNRSREYYDGVAFLNNQDQP